MYISGTDCTFIYSFLFVFSKILRYLLPAFGLQEQNDPTENNIDAWGMLDYPNFYILPTNYARMEQHRHPRLGK